MNSALNQKKSKTFGTEHRETMKPEGQDLHVNVCHGPTRKDYSNDANKTYSVLFTFSQQVKL